MALTRYLRLAQLDRSVFLVSVAPLSLVFDPFDRPPAGTDAPNKDDVETAPMDDTAVGPFPLAVHPLAPIVGPGIIGRSRQCDIRLDNTSISSAHAELEHRDDAWYLRDLNSRNGTYLGGVKLVPRTWQQLKAGCSVQFGFYHMRLFTPASLYEVLRSRYSTSSTTA